MTWTSKVLGTSELRTAKVLSKSRPNKKGFVTITTDSQDEGQVPSKTVGHIKKGDTIEYVLEKKEYTNSELHQSNNSFMVTILKDISKEENDDPQPPATLQEISINNLLFIDIETVRLEETLNSDSALYDSWEYKRRNASEDYEEIALIESYAEKAPLYAEFGKVVCVTLAYLKGDEVVMTSVAHEDEFILLQMLYKELKALFKQNRTFQLCGHSIKGYDIPFLMRRSFVNYTPLHPCLDVAGLKPWEIHMKDIAEIWRGSGFYNASLINIAVAMGLPSPKSDIDGSMVSDVYYNGELERIVKYCEQDVLTTVNIVRVMYRLTPIEHAEEKEKTK